MLTRRENFLHALRRQPHDRMPAYFVLDSFNYPVGLPEELAKAAGAFTPIEMVVEAQKYTGLDVVVRITPSPVKMKYAPRMEQLENGNVSAVWTTPRGEMRSLIVPSVDSSSAFPVEHPIKELKDYDELMYLLETQEYSVDEAQIVEAQRHKDVLGDHGIAYANGPSTPIMDVARTWAGLQDFVFHMMEDPERIDRVLNRMAENYFVWMEMLAKHTPYDVIVIYDDCNTLYLSRNMFAQYSLPVLQRYSEICHKYGKIFVNHTCGRINAFLDMYAQTGNDSIDWLTPAPTGDVSPANAMKHFDGKMVPMLTPVPSVLRNESPESVVAHLRWMLDQVDTSKVIMMVPPPLGSPIENAKAAGRLLIEDYGVPQNRSEQFGSMFD